MSEQDQRPRNFWLTTGLSAVIVALVGLVGVLLTTRSEQPVVPGPADPSAGVPAATTSGSSDSQRASGLAENDPPVRNQGVLTLARGASADLDSLKRNWSTETAGDSEDIENDNGELLATYSVTGSHPGISYAGTGSVSFSTCESASDYKDSIDPKPAIGMRFCVETDENRHAVLAINRLEMHPDGGVEKYVFDVKTWDVVTE
jgi:hypothetical protein